MLPFNGKLCCYYNNFAQLMRFQVVELQYLFKEKKINYSSSNNILILTWHVILKHNFTFSNANYWRANAVSCFFCDSVTYSFQLYLDFSSEQHLRRMNKLKRYLGNGPINSGEFCRLSRRNNLGLYNSKVIICFDVKTIKQHSIES